MAAARPPVKVVVLGRSGAGKSALVRSLAPQLAVAVPRGPTRVPQRLEAAVHLAASGEPCDLEIWDCSGEPRLFALAAPFLHGAHVAILVLDLTSRESFAELEDCRDRFLRLVNGVGQDPIFVLVGTKVDLDRRLIDRRQAQVWAAQHGLAGYFETAALTEIDAEVPEHQLKLWYTGLLDGFCRGAEIALLRSDPLSSRAAKPTPDADPRHVPPIPGRALTHDKEEFGSSFFACAGVERKGQNAILKREAKGPRARPRDRQTQSAAAEDDDNCVVS